MFGDAAGAIMLEPNAEGLGFQDSILESDGSGAKYLHLKAGGSVKPATHETVATVNIVKIAHWISTPKIKRKAFSLSSIKTVYHNELLLNRFISTFGISSNTRKNVTTQPHFT